MKIHEYYHITAKMSLNGSIAALIPAMLIIGSNLSLFHNKEIMVLTFPFLIYSIICFQIYLFRMKQSIEIEENMPNFKKHNQTLFEASHLLVINLNTQIPRVLLFFPNGNQAGEFKKYRSDRLPLVNGTNWYVLCNNSEEILGFYKVKGSKKIEVFNEFHTYLGCFEKTKKGKKELQNASGKYIGAVVGSSFYMDERIYNKDEQQIIRLQKGWMPVEWSYLFPEPNTPVLTFTKSISEKEKLLRMSFLINKFFN